MTRKDYNEIWKILQQNRGKGDDERGRLSVVASLADSGDIQTVGELYVSAQACGVSFDNLERIRNVLKNYARFDQFSCSPEIE